MRRLEQRIACSDDTGRQYVVEVFVNPISVAAYFGTFEFWGDRECWLRSGDCYQPVNVVEALEVFTFVVHGQILTLRRVCERRRLSSFLRLPAWNSSPRTAAGPG